MVKPEEGNRMTIVVGAKNTHIDEFGNILAHTHSLNASYISISTTEHTTAAYAPLVLKSTITTTMIRWGFHPIINNQDGTVTRIVALF